VPFKPAVLSKPALQIKPALPVPVPESFLTDIVIPALFCLIAAAIIFFDIHLWESNRKVHLDLPVNDRIHFDMLNSAGTGTAGLNNIAGLNGSAYTTDYVGDSLDKTGPAGGSADKTGSAGIPFMVTNLFEWEDYTVKRGDSVSKIASDNGLSMDAIIASNYLKDARRLNVGDTIRIPNMDGIPYTVKASDTYSKIANAFKVPLDVILDANDIQDDKIISGTMLFIPGAKLPASELRAAIGTQFIMPLKGKTSSNYGWRVSPITGAKHFHGAIDIAVNTGTPVKASADGRVAATGFNNVYGKFIILTHTNNFQTLYAHLDSVNVKNGASIKQGMKIGESGNTGQSTGPHLHFALYKNGREINPLEYIK
jgi:murein DD-endopeptidase MepM/ murein hydrolase activator NlpD